MLKDLEEPELEHQRDTAGGEPEQTIAHFRASLWLGIAADIRRKRASREMKGHVSC
jgi:hypothetical protein